MDSKERATVMLLHGSSEDRLRQVMAQGLVSKEVQQDVENALTEAEDARAYAESMRRENDQLREDIKELQRRAKADASYYSKAVYAYRREEQRRKDNADRKETLQVALIGAGAFILANIIG